MLRSDQSACWVEKLAAMMGAGAELDLNCCVLQAGAHNASHRQAHCMQRSTGLTVLGFFCIVSRFSFCTLLLSACWCMLLVGAWAREASCGVWRQQRPHVLAMYARLHSGIVTVAERVGERRHGAYCGHLLHCPCDLGFTAALPATSSRTCSDSAGLFMLGDSV